MCNGPLEYLDTTGTESIHCDEKTKLIKETMYHEMCPVLRLVSVLCPCFEFAISAVQVSSIRFGAPWWVGLGVDTFGKIMQSDLSFNLRIRSCVLTATPISGNLMARVCTFQFCVGLMGSVSIVACYYLGEHLLHGSKYPPYCCTDEVPFSRTWSVACRRQVGLLCESCGVQRVVLCVGCVT